MGSYIFSYNCTRTINKMKTFIYGLNNSFLERKNYEGDEPDKVAFYNFVNNFIDILSETVYIVSINKFGKSASELSPKLKSIREKKRDCNGYIDDIKNKILEDNLSSEVENCCFDIIEGYEVLMKDVDTILDNLI